MLGLGGRVVCQAFLERADFVTHVEERFEGEPGFLDERAAAMDQPVLRQVPDRECCGFHDRAGIRFVQPRKNLEQRRFSGAVRSGEPDAFTIVDLPADSVEQHAIAKTLAQ